ncbi:MAG: hypothetical protein JST42_23030 [Bacteroidetes bacterium]|nr:hypothetical protein [Bacteroidota bacterium]
MAQEKYVKLRHFVPEGHPQVHPGMSTEAREMMPYLVETVSRGWTKLPKREDLEIFVTLKMEVPVLGVRKNGKEVYLHIFCNELMYPLYPIQLVIKLYEKYFLGKPGFSPDERNWIHSIPIPGTSLNPAETLLTHQLTQSLFWTVFMDYKRNKQS